MKKTVKFFLLIVCFGAILTVLCLNFFLSADVSNNLVENVTIRKNNFIYIIITTILIIGLIALIKYSEFYYTKIKEIVIVKYCIIGMICILYFFAQIYWINYKKYEPVADQLAVQKLSVDIYKNDYERYGESLYFQLYPQQITLANDWHYIYKVLKKDSSRVIQYANAILNTGSLLLIYFITKKVDKKKNSGFGGLILFLLFIPISMLSTLVYGDIPGFFFCLMAILFIFKYVESKKIYNFIISLLSMFVAYSLRMNNLIVLIAIILYLGIGILEKEKRWKERIIRIVLIILYIIGTIIPNKAITKMYQNRYKLDSNLSFPVQGFICMGMYEGTRAAGWYNEEISKYAFDDAKSSKELYNEEIKKRIINFKNHPKEFIKFYYEKIATMWAENTYQSVWFNIDFYSTDMDGIEKNETMFKYEPYIKTLTKAVVCVIFGFSILIIAKERTNISDEIVLLCVLFCGGFMFHILWEAKSRYIVTYILYLIPVAICGIRDILCKQNATK